jgi:hypothetical protein
MIAIPSIHVTEDSEGKVVFGIVAKGHTIVDLSRDEGATMPVKPSYYRLTAKQVAFFDKMNKTLDDAAEDALNAGCLEIQRALGITSGDVADVHFSGAQECTPVRLALAKYLLSEVHISTKA